MVGEFVTRLGDSIVLAARRMIHRNLLSRTEQRKLPLDVFQPITVRLKSPVGSQFVHFGDVLFDTVPSSVEQLLRFLPPG